jgi:transcriptional regulator with XRE-family HTH domain
MDLADGIAYIRRSNNLSMSDLRDISGVETYIISNIENRRSNPNFNTISKLCEAVGMTVAEFFTVVNDLKCVS